MPPIENEVAEADFNVAVTLKLHLFEREREQKERVWGEWRERLRNRELAYMAVLAHMGKDLPEMPPPGEARSEPKQKTVQIVVNGEKRVVPAPPEGCWYSSSGELVRPQRSVRRF